VEYTLYDIDACRFRKRRFSLCILLASKLWIVVLTSTFTYDINSADFPMHVSRHIPPCAQAAFVRFNLFVLRRASRPLAGIWMCSLLTPAFARIISTH
jgi:hypothetical protein